MMLACWLSMDDPTSYLLLLPGGWFLV